MTREQREYKINQLLVLMLFTVFAVCILFVLLTGAGIYEQIIEKNQNCYEKRTAVQYLTTRIRQNDRKHAVEVRTFAGAEALVFKEIIHEKEYETVIYCYEGDLREIFSASAGEFSPEDGNKILEMKELTLEKDEDAVYATITDLNGNVQKIILHLRSGKEFFYEE